MKSVEIYSYYAFGYNYNILKSGVDKKKIEYVLRDLDEYLDTIKKLELQVTQQVLIELENVVEELREDDLQKTIDDEKAKEIKKLIDKADTTLDAELQLRKVLYVTPKRFNESMLLYFPGRLLAQGVWDKMSKTAQDDFSNSTKCIAFNSSTAAAFHLMRCVEEMLKVLYLYYVKQKRLKKPMWGSMVQQLQSKNNPKPSAALLETLDMIRRNFRNPTQHPDKFYNIDEAQDLLHNSIVLVNMIASEI